MNKPIVQYVGKVVPTDDGKAWLIPMDHPRKELNDTIICTSRVLVWGSKGEIETIKTRYTPVKLPAMDYFRYASVRSKA